MSANGANVLKQTEIHGESPSDYYSISLLQTTYKIFPAFFWQFQPHIYIKFLGILTLDIKVTYQQMITCSETSITLVRMVFLQLSSLMVPEHHPHKQCIILWDTSSQCCFPASVLQNSHS